MNNIRQVVIIDCGISNLGSITKAVEKCGGEVTISSNKNVILSASKLILPGVGCFSEGMERLHKLNLINAIQKAVSMKKVPILGICLGMQLLASRGFEGKECEGLNLISGEVLKMIPKLKNEKVPHVGWDEVEIRNDKNNPLFANVPNHANFYFVHSYHFVPQDEKDVTATTNYCGYLVSSIFNGKNVFGVQFHPEKSQEFGFQLLNNFLNFEN